MIKIENQKVKTLINLYEGKLMMLDFEPKQALQVVKDLKKLKEADDTVEQFRKSLVKKYKLDAENPTEEDNKKASEEYIKVLLEKVEIDINPLPEKALDNLKISGLEAITLEDTGLYSFD